VLARYTCSSMTKFDSELTQFIKHARTSERFVFKKGKNWNEAVISHFKNIRKPRFGIYIIRNPKKGVLYVGKGGTVTQNGEYRPQNLKTRLTNRRGKDSSRRWINNILAEGYASISVQCLVFDQETLIAPAYAEACLLQAYRVDHKGELPPNNKHF